MRWLSLLVLIPGLSWATLLVPGPNCLNTVLVHQGLAQSYRYTSNVEMQVVLESPLCRRVLADRRGAQSIGVVRDLGRFAAPGVYSHAYVYLGAGLAFEKIGQGVAAGQRMGPEQQILDDYEAGVLTRVDYYRCDGGPAWRTQLAGGERRLLDAMNRFEEELARLMARSLQADASDDLAAYGERLRRFGKRLRSATFVHQLLRARLVSLSYQLELLGASDLRRVTRAFELDATRLPELPELL